MTDSQKVPAVKTPAFRGYIPELDGVRAIGTILVIGNHIWPWEGYIGPALVVLRLPWMLIDMFFVVSGFLITSILLDTRKRPDYFKSFYVRRALRILPIYYAVLIFISTIAIVNGHDAYRNMVEHWGGLWWFYVYLGNIPTAITGHEPLAAGQSLVPLWSLQVEEQFYLLFPLLVHRLRLITLTRVLIGLCCFSTLLRFYFYFRFPQNEYVQYVLLPCHMEGLAMGAWVAIRFRQGPWLLNPKRLNLSTLFWVILSVGSAAWAGYVQTTPFNRTFGFLLSSIACTCVLLWIIQYSGSRRIAWIRSAPLRYLGKISYCAYLVHYPISNIVTGAARFLRVRQMEEGMLRVVIIYLLTFCVSFLSWHFFEKPLALLKDRLFAPTKVQRPV